MVQNLRVRYFSMRYMTIGASICTSFVYRRARRFDRFLTPLFACGMNGRRRVAEAVGRPAKAFKSRLYAPTSVMRCAKSCIAWTSSAEGVARPVRNFCHSSTALRYSMFSAPSFPSMSSALTRSAYRLLSIRAYLALVRPSIVRLAAIASRLLRMRSQLARILSWAFCWAGAISPGREVGISATELLTLTSCEDNEANCSLSFSS